MALGRLASLEVVARAEAAASYLLKEDEVVHICSSEGLEDAHKVAREVVVACGQVVAHVSNNEDGEAVVSQAFPAASEAFGKDLQEGVVGALVACIGVHVRVLLQVEIGGAAE